MQCNGFTKSTPLLWLMNMVLTLFYKNFNSLAKITIHNFWLIESLKTQLCSKNTLRLLQCQLQSGLSNCLVTNIIIYWSIVPWTNLVFISKLFILTKWIPWKGLHITSNQIKSKTTWSSYWIKLHPGWPGCSLHKVFVCEKELIILKISSHDPISRSNSQAIATNIRVILLK